MAVRGRDLQTLVDSLRRLNDALATKQGQLVQLVDSSAKVFRAFASQDTNISRAVRDLPGTLSQTTATLAKVTTFARLLGPTSTKLLPFAHALPAANAALSALAVPSTPIVKNQIRPFVIASRPTVRQLKPASINLAKATPSLTGTFSVLNHLGNMLGYSPSGTGQHGYLWWLAWLDHNARTLFSMQDANGVFRPLFLQASCAALNQISNGIAGSSLLLNLNPIIGPTGLCNNGTQGGSGGGHLSHPAAAPLTQQELELIHRHRNHEALDGNRQPLNHQDRFDGRLRALLRGPAAVHVAVLRWCDPLQSAGLPSPHRLPGRQPAGQPGRRPDRRRLGRQGDRQVSGSEGQPHDRHDPDEQQLRAHPQGRPRHPAREDDPRRDLRGAHPGHTQSPTLADNGLLSRSNVEPAVQLDQIFNALNPTTRQAFRQWQQELAKSIKGNDQNLNSVLGNLPSFAADATNLLQVLDVQHTAVVHLLQNGGTVFAALSKSQSALRNLITTGETTFHTTAVNNTAIVNTFHVFPTFLNETKLTMKRLQTFSTNTDPLIKELEPVAANLKPTLHAVRVLSPYLRSLFKNLGPLITAAKTGLPATAQVLHGLDYKGCQKNCLLEQLGPFLSQLNPIFTWLSLHQQLVSDFISNGAYALAAKTTPSSGHRQHRPLPAPVRSGGRRDAVAGRQPRSEQPRQHLPAAAVAGRSEGLLGRRQLPRQLRLAVLGLHQRRRQQACLRRPDPVHRRPAGLLAGPAALAAARAEQPQPVPARVAGDFSSK